MRSISVRLICWCVGLHILLLLFVVPTISAQASSAAKADPLKNLQFRSIGPFRGGRVGAVEGIAGQPNVYYFGATGGGVWKTTDAGVNWFNVSDGFFKTGSVGAINAADSDPNTLYVGMGEQTLRGNVSSGDGMYKSVDGGKSWKHIGLGDSQHISRIRVHPKDPETVYVAVIGHLWGKNDERGVFRTRDGGKTWQKILFRNSGTGASELAMDPSNPNTLYAGFWEVSRKPYRMDSGGEGSGLFKSTDGGDTWTEITRNRGLPSGLNGKMNITVSPVNPNRLFAMVENKDGGLFTSNDAGETWQRVSESAAIRQRPWYYNRVYADTENENTVYVLNVGFHKSIDGGRTFTTIPVPHSDNHDLWIAPNDAKRMINGNDGGANVSFNSGGAWTEQDQATAQFYRVTTDNDFPYNIYGAQQDNSTIRIASRSDGNSITERDWFSVGGGESGWIAPHPENSDIVFAGSYDGLLTRWDRRTGQERNIDVYPENPMGSGAEGTKYRFQWNFPIVFSPHKTNGKYPLYTAANVMFRSMDEGQSWQPISPDLTRNDKLKQKHSGGAISGDNTSVEYYDTIFSVDESPVKAGVIWAGTDDGLVQVSENNGQSWANVTPKDMPEWIQINHIRASPHDAGSAYFAAANYKNDDQKPYLYKTSDYGKTWKKIVNGIPADHFTRAITEDPNRRGMLFAGTERSLYYSSNDGESWQSLQLNLPVVPITDLTVQKREKDLVVATQGRSFYVLDNLPVLYQLAEAEKAAAFLFKPEDAYRTAGGGGFGGNSPTATVGRNPASGAVVNYYLRDKPTREVTVEFLDSQNAVLRKFTRRIDAPVSAPPAGPGGFGGGGDPQPPAEVGLNTFAWNYRLPNAVTIQGLIMWGGSLAGPRIPPGNYSVRLTVDGKAVATEPLAVKADTRLTTTQEDFGKQFDLMKKIGAKLTDTHNAINELRDMRAQIEAVSRRLKPENKDLIDKAKDIVTKLTEVEETLHQTKIRSGQDALNFPIRLNNKLAALSSFVDSSDDGPTASAYVVFTDLTSLIDIQLTKYASVKSQDIADFNKQYLAKGLPVIVGGK